MKKISVIIPTYKRSKYLERAIESILNQTYKNIEIIVVDDNGKKTPDQISTEKKLQKYITNKQIIYLIHEKNKNGAAARNTGIKMATGDYITFLDDDDFFLKKRFEIIITELEKQSNQKYAGAYTSMVKVKNNKIINYRKANKSGKLLNDVLSQYSFWGTGSNMIFRSTAIKEIGLFDENFFRLQDMEYMTRFMEKYEIFGIDSILVVKCEEDNMNMPNIDRIFKAKKMYNKKFEVVIENSDIRNDILYNLYKELFIFSTNKQDSYKYKKILTNYSKVKFKDIILHYYYNFSIKNILFSKIDYVIRATRCIKCCPIKDKKEIFSILK